MPYFVKQTFLRAPAESVFSWHAMPGALDRLTPPWEHVEVLERRGGLEAGARVTLRMYAGPLPLTWQAEHGKCVLGREFNDVQVSGPFARWEHQHRFIPCTGGCLLEDRINYELPLGIVGRWLGEGFVQRKLARAFEYRHAVTSHDIEAHQNAKSSGKLKVLITGATGLIGTQLRNFLLAGGHEVKTLGRDARSDIQWDPKRSDLDASQLEGLDAVVHLAGENVAAGRWNGTRKRRILESRVMGTAQLSEALAKLKKPPRVFVCASAIGIYGHAGDQDLDETSAPGTGFLADVCRKWEQACEPAQRAKIRVVNLRVGVVLSPLGGALSKMLPALKLGFGSNLGTGRQWISWISMDDLLRSIYHAITHDEVHGPVNACAPNPVRQQDFARVLGKVLSRPTIRFLPSFMTSLPLRLVLGEMAQELLLEGSRVRPRTLMQSGFTFCHEHLEPALRHLLGRPSEVVRLVSDTVPA